MSKKSVVPKLRFPEFCAGWELMPFDKFFDFHQTNTFSRNEMNIKNGKVKNIHYGDVLIKYDCVIDNTSIIPYINEGVDLARFREISYLLNGDIIIADTAEDLTAGKAVEIQNIDCFILAGLHTMLCRPKNISAPNFFGYYLNSSAYHNSVKPLLTGTKVYSISKSNIKKTNIVIPEFSEQQKIADCLTSLDELITAELNKLAFLKTHKKGLMQKLFPAEGKTVPEWRFLEFINDEKWKRRKISEITSYVDYRGKTPKKSENGIFLVTAKNVKMGYIDYPVSQEFIPISNYDEVMRRGLPKIGDVIITTEAPLGNVAQIDKTDIALAQRIIKYRGNKTILDNTYLKFVFLSPKFQSILLSKSTGGTVKGIKGSVLHELIIDVPHMTEQQKIADCLSAIDDKITAQAEKIETLKQHKKGLMQGLFPSAQEVME